MKISISSKQEIEAFLQLNCDCQNCRLIYIKLIRKITGLMSRKQQIRFASFVVKDTLKNIDPTPRGERFKEEVIESLKNTVNADNYFESTYYSANAVYNVLYNGYYKYNYKKVREFIKYGLTFVEINNPIEIEFE